MSTPKTLFDCQFDIAIAVHYHMRRQQFFEAYHRLTGVFSLIFSTSAVVLIVGKGDLGIVLAGAVAILQSIDLIIDARGKSNTHNELRRDYLVLNQELISYGDEPSNEQLREFSKKKNVIEMAEPPVKKVLLELANNDAVRNLGCDPSHIIQVSWFKSNTANFFNWPSSIPNQ